MWFWKKSLCCLITSGNQCTVHVQMFFSQRWEHSVDSRSSRCSPTYYSCNRKALSQNSHRVSEPSKKTLLSFEDCEELIAKLLANYKCCFFYKWNLICEGWQWVHSLFISSGTGNRSIHRAHQKPQELDAEATGFWTSEQSPIEKLGRLDTSFFHGEPLHCRGGLCVCVWRIMLWLSP